MVVRGAEGKRIKKELLVPLRKVGIRKVTVARKCFVPRDETKRMFVLKVFPLKSLRNFCNGSRKRLSFCCNNTTKNRTATTVQK